jgi:hypothetical protein
MTATGPSSTGNKRHKRLLDEGAGKVRISKFVLKSAGDVCGARD